MCGFASNKILNIKTTTLCNVYLKYVFVMVKLLCFPIKIDIYKMCTICRILENEIFNRAIFCVLYLNSQEELEGRCNCDNRKSKMVQ